MKRYRMTAWDEGHGIHIEDLPSERGPWVLHSEAEAEIAALKARVAELEAENVCDSCLGAGKSLTGGPCMCDGTGLLTRGVTHLRERIFDLEAKVARIERLANACLTEPIAPAFLRATLRGDIP